MRRAVIRTGYGLALIATTGLLLVAGLSLVLWAFYQYVAAAIGAPATALVTGIAALLAAGGLAWIIHRISR